MGDKIRWTCPFCQHDTILDEDQDTRSGRVVILDTRDNDVLARSEFKRCPNADCKAYTLDILLMKAGRDRNERLVEGETFKSWRLLPQSNAKVFPEYVPAPLLVDYNEACSIVRLSPKAAATLARRCLQGMIRDFWDIKKGRLIDEIAALEGKVPSDTWLSIEAVRDIGNIGAHMEKDINVIIDVEPEEAELLIGLVETLIRDWYIEREERNRRNVANQNLAAAKKAQKTASLIPPPAQIPAVDES